MPLIDTLLKKIDAPTAAPTEKTASATTASLDDRINAALAQLGTEKTASPATPAAPVDSPVGALMKVAAEAAAADNDANIKLAHQMGAAFVDGQVARMQMYEKAAAELEPEPTEAEKVAAFNAGFQETAELIHKTAAAHFVIGHDAVVAAIESR